MSEHTHVFEPVGGLAVECECGAYFEGQEICDAVQGSYELTKLRALNAELLEALESAVACGLIPTTSASEGGAARFSEQVKAADMVRAAIAKAKGESVSLVTSEAKSESERSEA